MKKTLVTMLLVASYCSAGPAGGSSRGRRGFAQAGQAAQPTQKKRSKIRLSTTRM